MFLGLLTKNVIYATDRLLQSITAVKYASVHSLWKEEANGIKLRNSTFFQEILGTYRSTNERRYKSYQKEFHFEVKRVYSLRAKSDLFTLNSTDTFYIRYHWLYWEFSMRKFHMFAS